MRLKITGGKVWTPDFAGFPAVLVEDGKITAVSEAVSGFDNCKTLDASGLTVVPGFLDLHVHGGGRRCCMEGTPEAVLAMASAHARFGTTTILPTTWTAPLDQTLRAIDAVRRAAEGPCPSTIAGVHLEGPCLSPEQSGAQDPGSLRIPADGAWRDLVACWKDGVRMVGIAPELPGAAEMGDELAAQGIVVSIAHSQAFEPDIRQAVAHGFTDVTHLYNACSTFIRRGGFRIPGVVECGLAMDSLKVQVIADGCHIPLLMLLLIWKAKGTDGMYLITDALDYAGTSIREGTRYIQQNGMEVVYEDGVMKLLSRQAFAGSVATADRLLRTAVEAGIPFGDALRMLTVNPAKRIGLEQRKGGIRPGLDADLVFLDDALQVVGVVAGGKVLRWDRENREPDREHKP